MVLAIMQALFGQGSEIGYQLCVAVCHCHICAMQYVCALHHLVCNAPINDLGCFKLQATVHYPDPVEAYVIIDVAVCHCHNRFYLCIYNI